MAGTEEPWGGKGASLAQGAQDELEWAPVPRPTLAVSSLVGSATTQPALLGARASGSLRLPQLFVLGASPALAHDPRHLCQGLCTPRCRTCLQPQERRVPGRDAPRCQAAGREAPLWQRVPQPWPGGCGRLRLPATSTLQPSAVTAQRSAASCCLRHRDPAGQCPDCGDPPVPRSFANTSAGMHSLESQLGTEWSGRMESKPALNGHVAPTSQQGDVPGAKPLCQDTLPCRQKKAADRDVTVTDGSREPAGAAGSIAGVYVEASKKIMSFYDATREHLLSLDPALCLLEAQAATGSIADPVMKRHVSVAEAVQLGLLGLELKERLLSAEKAATGFVDPYTEEKISLFQAIQKDLIGKEQGARLLQAQMATGGIIDLATGCRLPTDAACQRGYLDEETRQLLSDPSNEGSKGFLNPSTMERVTYTELMKRCVVDPASGFLLLPLQITFPGLGGRVSSRDLLDAGIISLDTFRGLEEGRVSAQEMAENDLVQQFLRGTRSVAGVVLPSGERKSLYQALREHLLVPGAALMLLQVQASTGSLTDPAKNRTYSADEAVRVGLIGPELHEKLSSAERTLTGYKDPCTGETLSLFQAIRKGFIPRDHGICLLEAQMATGGIIAPGRHLRVPTETACRWGYLDEATRQLLSSPTDDMKGFFDPSSKEKLIYADLLKRCVTDPDTGLLLLPLGGDSREGSEGTHLFFDHRSQTALENTEVPVALGKFKGKPVSLWRLLFSDYVPSEHRAALAQQYLAGTLSTEELGKEVSATIEEMASMANVTFEGLRDRVTADQLLSSEIINKDLFKKLKEGETSAKEVVSMDTVKKYLQGTGSIGGLLLPDSQEKISIYQAKRKGLLRPGTSLILLEAQAATGFIIDPAANLRYSVEEALRANVIGPDVYDKLLTAEKSVTGYRDPYSGNKISLFQAMKKELIVREHAIRLLEAQIATGGIIDPVHSHRIPVEVAYRRGYFDKKMNLILSDPSDDTKGFFDPNTHENLTYLQLKEKCITEPSTGLCLLPLNSRKRQFIDDATRQVFRSSWLPVRFGRLRGQKVSVWDLLNSEYFSEGRRREVFNHYRLRKLTLEQIRLMLEEEMKKWAPIKFPAMRGSVSAYHLMETGVIDKALFEKVLEGSVTADEVLNMDSVRKYLYGSGSVGGIVLQPSNQRISIYEAMKKNIMVPGVALPLLEAQAATGFIIDPVNNQKLCVDDAIKEGVIGPDVHEKLQHAEGAVTGYKDPFTGKKIPLFQAMKKGLIADKQAMQLMEVQMATGGIIDPACGHYIPIESAQKRGCLDEDMSKALSKPSDNNRAFCVPDSKEAMTYAELIKRCQKDEISGFHLLPLAQAATPAYTDEQIQQIFKETLVKEKGVSLWELIHSGYFTEEQRSDFVERFRSEEASLQQLVALVLRRVGEMEMKARTHITLEGLRGSVPVVWLLDVGIITEETFEELARGVRTPEEVAAMESVKRYLQGTGSIAGVFIEASKQKMSFYDAMKSNLLPPGVAVRLLEAQAATGYLTDPATNRRLGVRDAVKAAVVGEELSEKLLLAERAVTGYKDPYTGSSISLCQALRKDLIPLGDAIPLLEAQLATGGVIDPIHHHHLPLQAACRYGFYDEELNQTLSQLNDTTKTFFDPNMKENVTYQQLKDRCVHEATSGLWLLPLSENAMFCVDEQTMEVLKSVSVCVNVGRFKGQTVSVWDLLNSEYLSDSKRRELVLKYKDENTEVLQEIITIVTTIIKETETQGKKFAFKGLRKRVSASDLFQSQLIDKKTLDELNQGKRTVEEVTKMDSVRRYLEGSNFIAGVLIHPSNEKMSIYQAMWKGILRPGTALVLLEAQAATGYIIDPEKNKKFSVEEALTAGLIGGEVFEKLLCAERAVTGYTDPYTKAPMSLFEAMNQGLIVKSHGIRLLEAQIATGGIIDPVHSHRIPVEVAYQRGYFNQEMNQVLSDPSDDTKGFFDPNTHENLTYMQLLERCVQDEETGLYMLQVVQEGGKYFYIDEYTKQVLQSKPLKVKVGKFKDQTVSIWEILCSHYISVQKRKELVMQYKSKTLTLEDLTALILKIIEDTEHRAEALKVKGLRGEVSVSELFNSEIIDKKTLDQLQDGSLTLASLANRDTIKRYLDGTGCISGVLLPSRKEKMSIYQALKKGLLTEQCALGLLEAQAATGFLIDPLKNKKLSVDEAVASGLVGSTLHKKLLTAEKAVMGYTDPQTGHKMSLFQAIKQKMTVKEHGIRLLEAQLATGGIIDPVHSHRLPVEVAYRRGYLDDDMFLLLSDPDHGSKGFIDPNTHEKISYSQLLERCSKDRDTGLYLLQVMEKQDDYFYIDEQTKTALLCTKVEVPVGKYKGKVLSLWELLCSEYITEEKRKELVKKYKNESHHIIQGIIATILDIIKEKEEARSDIWFQGLRQQITASELLSAQIITEETMENLHEGKETAEDIAQLQSVRRYLEGTGSIAGVLVPSKDDPAKVEKMSIYQAMWKGILRPGTALVLLEAQAATGFLIDPVTNKKLSVDEAVSSGLVGSELQKKLLCAEKAVTGYSHPCTGQKMSLFQAMKKELIVREHGIRLLEAQIATGGIIDPVHSHRLPVEVAYRRGYFDQEMNQVLSDPSDDTKGFFDPNTHENLTYMQLLHRCVPDPDTGLLMLQLMDKGSVLYQLTEDARKALQAARTPVSVGLFQGQSVTVWELLFSRYVPDHRRQDLLRRYKAGSLTISEMITILTAIVSGAEAHGRGTALVHQTSQREVPTTAENGEVAGSEREREQEQELERTLRSRTIEVTAGEFQGRKVSLWELLFSKYLSEAKRQELLAQVRAGSLELDELARVLALLIEEVVRRSSNVKFTGLRRQVTASDLLDSGIIDKETLADLVQGSKTVEEVTEMASVKRYLDGTGCIAGVLVPSKDDPAKVEKMSIYQAMWKGILRQGTALVLLEAQAATGFLVDPLTNKKLSVDEAVSSGLVGSELQEKLLSAERAVTGYKDPYTGDQISLFQAMRKELIVREHGIRLLEAQIATGGIIDPVHSHRLPVEVAYRRGYFDQEMNQVLSDTSDDTKGFFDPNTHENLTYMQLLRRCVPDPDTGLLMLQLMDKGSVLYQLTEDARKALQAARTPVSVGLFQGQSVTVWELLFSRYVPDHRRQDLLRRYKAGSLTISEMITILTAIVSGAEAHGRGTALVHQTSQREVPTTAENGEVAGSEREREQELERTLRSRTIEVTAGEFQGRKVSLWELLFSKYLSEAKRQELLAQVREGSLELDELARVLALLIEEVVRRSSNVKFTGLRRQVTASDLLDSGIIDKETLADLVQGSKTVEEVTEMASVKRYLDGTGCIAGVLVPSKDDPAKVEKMSIYQAMWKGILRQGTALVLLEAQAATGFLVDPLTNKKLSVDEAVSSGLVGSELQEKLLSAERAVTGYKDPYTGDQISLFQAMRKELIVREHGIRLLEAQIATGGIIDPVHSHRLPVEVAYRRGYFDQEMNQVLSDPSDDTKGFFDPNTHENLTYMQLLRRCVPDPDTGLYFLNEPRAGTHGVNLIDECLCGGSGREAAHRHPSAAWLRERMLVFSVEMIRGGEHRDTNPEQLVLTKTLIRNKPAQQHELMGWQETAGSPGLGRGPRTVSQKPLLRGTGTTIHLRVRCRAGQTLGSRSRAVELCCLLGGRRTRRAESPQPPAALPIPAVPSPEVPSGEDGSGWGDPVWLTNPHPSLAVQELRRETQNKKAFCPFFVGGSLPVPSPGLGRAGSLWALKGTFVLFFPSEAHHGAARLREQAEPALRREELAVMGELPSGPTRPAHTALQSPAQVSPCQGSQEAAGPVEELPSSNPSDHIHLTGGTVSADGGTPAVLGRKKMKWANPSALLSTAPGSQLLAGIPPVSLQLQRAPGVHTSEPAVPSPAHRPGAARLAAAQSTGLQLPALSVGVGLVPSSAKRTGNGPHDTSVTGEDAGDAPSSQRDEPQEQGKGWGQVWRQQALESPMGHGMATCLEMCLWAPIFFTSPVQGVRSEGGEAAQTPAHAGGGGIHCSDVPVQHRSPPLSRAAKGQQVHAAGGCFADTSHGRRAHAQSHAPGSGKRPAVPCTAVTGRGLQLSGGGHCGEINHSLCFDKCKTMYLQGKPLTSSTSEVSQRAGPAPESGPVPVEAWQWWQWWQWSVSVEVSAVPRVCSPEPNRPGQRQGEPPSTRSDTKGGTPEQPNPSQNSPTTTRTTQTRTSPTTTRTTQLKPEQPNHNQNNPNQNNPTTARTTQPNTEQPKPEQPNPNQNNPTTTRTTQLKPEQPNHNQNNPNQNNPTTARTTQPNTEQPKPEQPNPKQNKPTKTRTTQPKPALPWERVPGEPVRQRMVAVVRHPELLGRCWPWHGAGSLCSPGAGEVSILRLLQLEAPTTHPTHHELRQQPPLSTATARDRLGLCPRGEQGRLQEGGTWPEQSLAERQREEEEEEEEDQSLPGSQPLWIRAQQCHPSKQHNQPITSPEVPAASGEAGELLSGVDQRLEPWAGSPGRQGLLCDCRLPPLPCPGPSAPASIRYLNGPKAMTQRVLDQLGPPAKPASPRAAREPGLGEQGGSSAVAPRPASTPLRLRATTAAPAAGQTAGAGTATSRQLPSGKGQLGPETAAERGGGSRAPDPTPRSSLGSCRHIQGTASFHTPGKPHENPCLTKPVLSLSAENHGAPQQQDCSPETVQKMSGAPQNKSSNTGSSLAAGGHKEMGGSNFIAGVFIQAMNKKLSIYDAMMRGLLTPGTALVLLEAQAASGFLTDPVRNEKLSVKEALTAGLIGRDFYEKLLSAEGAVTGYTEPYTGCKISLFQAMKKEFIVREHAIRLLEAQLATGGIIDPVHSHRLPVEEAYRRGYFDQEMCQFLSNPKNQTRSCFDPNTHENLTYTQLLRRCVPDPDTGLLMLHVMDKGSVLHQLNKAARKALQAARTPVSVGLFQGQSVTVWELLFSRYVPDHQREELLRKYKVGTVSIPEMITILTTIITRAETENGDLSSSTVTPNNEVGPSQPAQDTHSQEQQLRKSLKSATISVTAGEFQGQNISLLDLLFSRYIPQGKRQELLELYRAGVLTTEQVASVVTTIINRTGTANGRSPHKAVTRAEENGDDFAQLDSILKSITIDVPAGEQGRQVSVWDLLHSNYIPEEKRQELLELYRERVLTLEQMITVVTTLIKKKESTGRKFLIAVKTSDKESVSEAAEKDHDSPKEEPWETALKTTVVGMEAGEFQGHKVSVWDLLHSKYIPEENRKELLELYQAGELTLEQVKTVVSTIVTKAEAARAAQAADASSPRAEPVVAEAEQEERTWEDTLKSVTVEVSVDEFQGRQVSVWDLLHSRSIPEEKRQELLELYRAGTLALERLVIVVTTLIKKKESTGRKFLIAVKTSDKDSVSEAAEKDHDSPKEEPWETALKTTVAGMEAGEFWGHTVSVWDLLHSRHIPEEGRQELLELYRAGTLSIQDLASTASSAVTAGRGRHLPALPQQTMDLLQSEGSYITFGQFQEQRVSVWELLSTEQISEYKREAHLDSYGAGGLTVNEITITTTVITGPRRQKGPQQEQALLGGCGCGFLRAHTGTGTGVCHTAVCHRAVCHRAVCHTGVCHRAVCATELCVPHGCVPPSCVCHRAVCHTGVCHRAVCATELCHTGVCHRAVCATELCATRVCATELCVPPSCVCHTGVCHRAVCHRAVCATRMCATELCATELCVPHGCVPPSCVPPSCVCHTGVCHRAVCATRVCATRVCVTELCATKLCVPHGCVPPSCVRHTGVCHTGVCHRAVCHQAVCATELCATRVCATELCATKPCTHVPPGVCTQAPQSHVPVSPTRTCTALSGCDTMCNTDAALCRHHELLWEGARGAELRRDVGSAPQPAGLWWKELRARGEAELRTPRCSTSWMLKVSLDAKRIWSKPWRKAINCKGWLFQEPPEAQTPGRGAGRAVLVCACPVPRPAPPAGASAGSWAGPVPEPPLCSGLAQGTGTSSGCVGRRGTFGDMGAAGEGKGWAAWGAARSLQGPCPAVGALGDFSVPWQKTGVEHKSPGTRPAGRGTGNQQTHPCAHRPGKQPPGLGPPCSRDPSSPKGPNGAGCHLPKETRAEEQAMPWQPARERRARGPAEPLGHRPCCGAAHAALARSPPCGQASGNAPRPRPGLPRSTEPSQLLQEPATPGREAARSDINQAPFVRDRLRATKQNQRTPAPDPRASSSTTPSSPAAQGGHRATASPTASSSPSALPRTSPWLLSPASPCSPPVDEHIETIPFEHRAVTSYSKCPRPSAPPLLPVPVVSVTSVDVAHCDMCLLSFPVRKHPGKRWVCWLRCVELPGGAQAEPSEPGFALWQPAAPLRAPTPAVARGVCRVPAVLGGGDASSCASCEKEFQETARRDSQGSPDPGALSGRALL
ncbi:epiplakin [Podargus strigoides]